MSINIFDEDEVVLLKDSKVSAKGSSVTLILTNRSIIQINKSFWGTNKDAEKYPLLDLKEHNGKPNILVGKAPNGNARLELYFDWYELYYSFQGLFAERKWAKAIEKAYKACAEEKKRNERTKMKVEDLLSPLKSTLESARNAIVPKPKAPVIKEIKCPRCGAELSGEIDSEVTCSYCDTNVIIK